MGMLATKSCDACRDRWRPLWAWRGEGAAIAKGESLWLIWSHTMRDALASKGALCKQKEGPTHWDTNNLSCFYKLIQAAA